MKRNTMIAVFLCGVLLTGCGQAENPYRVDTVVRIPVDPTDAPTEAPTEPEEPPASTETDESTETQAPTEVTEGNTESSGKKTTSSPKSSSTTKTSTGSKKSDSAVKQESTKTTEAAEPEQTAVPETEPPAEASETTAQTEPPYDPSDYSVGSLEKAILKEMNAYRVEAGLNELSISRKLSGIAALRAEEALAVWSHTRPDGRSYTTAMSDYGYGFGTSAENLAHASGSGDAAAMVAKWMDTDSKDNILNENFATAGIGVYRSGGVTLVAVLLVG